MSQKRNYICKPIRYKVYARDGWACLACGETWVPKLTLDHIRPFSMGGTDHPNNLQTLCKFCNKIKGPRVADLRLNKQPIKVR